MSRSLKTSLESLSSAQREALCRKLQKERLLACVSLQKAYNSVDPAILKAHLGKMLPEYMIPSQIITVPEIPRLPNGKLDRSKLSVSPVPEDDTTTGTNKFPQSETLNKLRAICADVLSCDVEPEDNFFEIGGDSIMSIQIISRARSEGIMITPVDLLDYPTLIELAQKADTHQQEKDEVQTRCIVPIRSKASGIPVFCIHDRRGLIMIYRRLAAYIPDSPLYCIKPVGLGDSLEPYHSFEAMARHYLREIKKVHPHGPYALVGYCASGPIAFELAQQIRQSGDSVSLLAMVDPSVPETSLIPYSNAWYRRFKRTYLIHGGNPRALLNMLVDAYRFRSNLLKDKFGLAAPDISDMETTAFLKAFDKAYEDYQPKHYNDSVLFIQSRQTRIWDKVFLKQGYADYWRDRTDGLEIVDIDCLHPVMMDDPNVRNVGRAISDWLKHHNRDTQISTAETSAS